MRLQILHRRKYPFGLRLLRIDWVTPSHIIPQCMKAYVEFEIQEGAYDISCPDALCQGQGILSISNEISVLVSSEFLERHKRFRLNRGKYAHQIHFERQSVLI